MSRGWKIASIIFAVLILALIATRLTISAIYNARCEEEIRLFKAEGGSLNLADMAPGPADKDGLILLDPNCFQYPPADATPGTGATDLAKKEHKDKLDSYRAITDWAKRNSRWLPVVTARGTPQDASSDSWLPLFEKHVEVNRDVLDKVRATLALDNAAFDIDWSKGRDVSLSHLSKCRIVVRLLCMDALVSAEKGDSAGAFDDIALAFRMRRLFDRDPAIVSQLVGMNTDTTACSCLQSVLALVSPDRKSYDALIADIGEPDRRGCLPHALLGDTAVGLEYFEAVARDTRVIQQIQDPLRGTPAPLTEWDRLRWLGIRLVWLSSADRRNYLASMREIRAQSRLPLPEALAAPQVAPPTPGPLATRLVSNWLVPSLGHAVQQEGTAAARVAAARTALACALYRAENGSNPPSLDALVPAYLPTAPTDPRTGAPLTYSPENGSFIDFSLDNPDHAARKQ